MNGSDRPITRSAQALALDTVLAAWRIREARIARWQCEQRIAHGIERATRRATLPADGCAETNSWASP